MVDQFIPELLEIDIPAVSVIQAKAFLASVVQKHLDDSVVAHGYGSLVAAISYIDSSVPLWASEALICREWRDSVWLSCYEIMDKVAEGKRTMPSPSILISELPILEW